MKNAVIRHHIPLLEMGLTRDRALARNQGHRHVHFGTRQKVPSSEEKSMQTECCSE